MNTTTFTGAVRVTFIVAVFTVVQQTVMIDLRIGGIHPDILVVLPIVAGVAGGPSRGATMGFWVGLVADLFLPTPFGLSALVGTIIGFTTGLGTLALDRTAKWLTVVAALVASACYEVLYGALGSVLGQPQMLHVDFPLIVVVVGVVNAIVALLALRMVVWALPEGSTERMPLSGMSLGPTR